MIRIKVGLSCILIYIFMGYGNAQIKTFSDSVNVFWNDDLNWTPTGVPSISDSVILDHAVIIPMGYTASANSIDILSNGDLLVERLGNSYGQIIIIGDLISTGIINFGKLTNHGKIILFNHKVGIINHSILKNEHDGTLDLSTIDYHLFTI